MTRIIHLQKSNECFLNNQKLLDEFKEDVLNGFSKTQKCISSKYFYDKKGSVLFNQITTHPDYYLTGCELEILEKYKNKIARLVKNKPFNLVELGPGEGIKTELLVHYFLNKELTFTYMPIDISSQYLNHLSKKLKNQAPNVDLKPIHSDYLNGLKWINLKSDTRNLVLFLGSSIGNFSLEEAKSFLRNISQQLHAGDYLIIGFDLRKNVEKLMKAYNDSAGITRQFNLNLLQRINRELGADFDLNKFEHYATYNVNIGSMESHLLSLEPQWITIKNINTSFYFEKIEAIHVEYSHKYLISQIESLANDCGFTIIEHLSDAQDFFVDSVWQVN